LIGIARAFDRPFCFSSSSSDFEHQDSSHPVHTLFSEP
jgi:hypothetical protein